MIKQVRRLGKFLNLQVAFLAAAGLTALCTPSTARAQVVQQAIGGVRIDADGIARSATVEDRQALLAAMRQQIAGAPADMKAAAGLRKISLKKLQQAMVEASAAGQALPEEIRYLAGLQKIQYVFVYPEEQDIVIAGPAEDWQINQAGTVVGVKSGMPVLQLDDLLVAFRHVEKARQESISVSIDPTAEGSQRLSALLKQVRLSAGANPAALEPAMREAFGPQMVTLTGAPTDSHLARVLLNADYSMKRIAMKLEPSPVKAIPSYLDMIRNTRVSSGNQPRWWLECEYESILKSEDGMAFEIRGAAIKALTEEELVATDGVRSGTGKANPMAKKWADNFTQQMDQLMLRESVYGELRNVMDLSVLAALVEANQLATTANCSLAVIQGTSGDVKTNVYPAPKALDPQCSFVKGAAGWVVSASGGVRIDSWNIAVNQSVEPKLASASAAAKTGSEKATWWWN